MLMVGQSGYLLLENGASINALNIFGMTALEYATTHDWYETVEVLV